MARWHSRVGTFVILAACAWLTWLIAPGYIDLLHPKPPLQAPRTYLFLGIIAVVVVAAALAVVVMFGRVAKPSNLTMQPTADRPHA